MSSISELSSAKHSARPNCEHRRARGSFIQRHRQQLFATTPMVLMAVDQRRVQYSDLTANDAVVAVKINYLSAFENILQVLPDTKDVIVVVGSFSD